MMAVRNFEKYQDRRAISGWGRRKEKGRSPLSFFKNRKTVPWFCKKSALTWKRKALFVCIFGLNCHLKCSFKSILEKKQNFSLQGPFVCRTWNVSISKCPYSKKSTLSQKFPDIFLKGKSPPWDSKIENPRHQDSMIKKSRHRVSVDIPLKMADRHYVHTITIKILKVISSIITIRTYMISSL